MNYSFVSPEGLTPARASLNDSPLDILKFAISAFDKGRVAFATLVEIREGAARPQGSHVAIAADGRYAGYVSGGCVEAAVAAEALQAMAIGRDRFVKFGNGSRYFDITLPCGGGITVAIHVVRNIEPLKQAVQALKTRRPVSLTYDPVGETLNVSKTISRSCWNDGLYHTVYRPRTRLVVSGTSVEANALSRLAEASDYDVLLAQREDSYGVHEQLDPFTAVAVLNHDLEDDIKILQVALESDAFYVGALGSTRTHLRRIDRLKSIGIPESKIERIRAPIGLFGPARDSNTLAISILSDISASQLASNK